VRFRDLTNIYLVLLYAITYIYIIKLINQSKAITMKTITIANGQTFDLTLYFSNTFKGRGGWNINLEADLDGKKFKSHIYTTDARFIDELNEMKSEKSWDEVQQFYSDNFLSDFDEELCEWIEDNCLTEVEE